MSKRPKPMDLDRTQAESYLHALQRGEELPGPVLLALANRGHVRQARTDGRPYEITARGRRFLEGIG